MKLLALIAASAYAFDTDYIKSDANRNEPPAEFAVNEGILSKGFGFCPKCEDEASLDACAADETKYVQCDGIENAWCEYTFKYDQNGDPISVSSQCKDHVACHDNMRQNFDKGNQILNKCQKGAGWDGTRNGRYGAEDFQCITCMERFNGVDAPDNTEAGTERDAVLAIENTAAWNSQ